MPNYVEQVIRFTAPPADLLAAIRGQDSDGEPIVFDFNALIPMPASVRDVEENGAEDMLPILMGTSSVVAAWENCRRHSPRREILGEWKGLMNYGPGEIEARLTLAYGADYLANARKMALAFGETGYRSWYDWSRAKWGTKWPAISSRIETNDGVIELRFDTAWAPPLPVLQELAKRFPHVAWDYWAFDEGWNFFATGRARDGTFTMERFTPQHGDEATIAAHRICYGEDPPPPEPEDDLEAEGEARLLATTGSPGRPV